MVNVKFRRTKTHHIVMQASDGSHGSYQKQTTTWIYLMQTWKNPTWKSMSHFTKSALPHVWCQSDLCQSMPCRHAREDAKTRRLQSPKWNWTKSRCVSHCTCWMALAMLQNHHNQPWLSTEAVAAYSVIGPGVWSWAHKKRKLASMSASSKPMTKLKASKLFVGKWECGNRR